MKILRTEVNIWKKKVKTTLCEILELSKKYKNKIRCEIQINFILSQY